MRQRHRVIRAIPMEMIMLRQAEDEDDEIILLELKEKQCRFISFYVLTTFHSLGLYSFKCSVRVNITMF